MKSKIYKVIFLNQGKVYELFCRSVSSSSMMGFVEVSELVLDTGEGVVVDPIEERMREEFGEVEVLYLPMHSVIRVEQVKKRGQSVIRERESGEKVTRFPTDINRSKR